MSGIESDQDQGLLHGLRTADHLDLENLRDHVHTNLHFDRAALLPEPHDQRAFDTLERVPELA